MKGALLGLPLIVWVLLVLVVLPVVITGVVSFKADRTIIKKLDTLQVSLTPVAVATPEATIAPTEVPTPTLEDATPTPKKVRPTQAPTSEATE